MQEQDQLYSIGQFADLSKLSVKQLRYLDEKGILVPTVRNQDNNYRYYEHEQLNHVVMIKTLRELGFPFEQVVYILENPGEAGLIDAILKRIEQADADIKEALFQYERLLTYYTQTLKSFSIVHSVEEKGKNEIKLIEFPRQTVVYTRNRVPVTSHQLFVDRYVELRNICYEKHVTISSSLMGLFHDGYMRQFEATSDDLETMVAVKKDYPLAKNVREFGGFQGVAAYHKGHYNQARMDNILTAFYTDQHLDAVLCLNDSVSLGSQSALKSAGYGTDDNPMPIMTGQDCDIANVKAIIAGDQSMSVFKDTKILAAAVAEMTQQILNGEEVTVNDTENYDNFARIVPSYLIESQYVDINNWEELLVDGGYYTMDELQ